MQTMHIVHGLTVANHAARVKKIENGYVLELSGDDITNGDVRYFCTELYAPTLYGVAHGLALFFGDNLEPPDEVPDLEATIAEADKALAAHNK